MDGQTQWCFDLQRPDEGVYLRWCGRESMCCLCREQGRSGTSGWDGPTAMGLLAGDVAAPALCAGMCPGNATNSSISDATNLHVWRDIILLANLIEAPLLHGTS
jgi:hypothetical protein